MAAQLTAARMKKLEAFLALLLESDANKRSDHLLSSFHAGTVNGMIVTAALYMNPTEQWYIYHRLKESGLHETAKRFIPA